MSERVARGPLNLAALRAKALVLGRQFALYFVVSVGALALDFALFLLLNQGLHLHYLAASAISFSSGAAVTYLLSVRLVFDERRLGDRRIEFASFFLIGLVGLAVNQLALLVTAGALAWPPLQAKVAAAGFSFVANFLARRTLLFTARQAP
jgi:putative flippase GtrA